MPQLGSGGNSRNGDWVNGQKRKWLENGSPLSFEAVVRAPYQGTGPVVQSRHHADDASGVNIFGFGKGPALPQHLDVSRESRVCRAGTEWPRYG